MRPHLMFKKASAFPMGQWLFSKLAAFKAPYFSSIFPYIQDLSETGCVILLKKRWLVQNHIGTVHAIAICNACEMAFGFTMEAGLPSHLRWIPAGMTVRYLKKAGTDLVATCKFPQILTLTPGNHVVHVDVVDKNNVLVVDADITVYISERPKK